MALSTKRIHWPTVILILVVLVFALFIYHHGVAKRSSSMPTGMAA